MTTRHPRLLLVALLAGGLLLRLLLGFAGYPGQGFAADINLFLQWSRGIAERGPAAFYGGDPTANYPPISVGVLWMVHALAVGWASVFGGTTDQALLVLVKLPAIVADTAVAALTYVIGRGVYGVRSGLAAAALYCLVPPVWYVSALWGQIDSLLVLFSLLSLALLIRGHSELAAVAAVAAVMVKPQGVVVVIVVAVVLLARHLSTAGDGRRIGRLLTSAAAALVTALLLIVPFDYEALAPARWAQIPMLGDLAGFVAQSLTTSRLFPVLTANAYNLWALVGDPALVHSVGTGTAVWTSDSLQVAGVAAGVIGLVLLAVAVLAVVIGLVVRHDSVAILFGYVVLSCALFVLPTRSHERYLLPAFSAAAVLAAPHLWRAAVYLVLGLVNLMNLHAVLAGPLYVITQSADGARPRPQGGGGLPGGSGAAPTDADPSARATDISLPLGDLARSELVAVTASVFQTATVAVLLVGWVVLVIRARRDPGQRLNPR